MKFQDLHKIFFNSINGSYSRVTGREHYDSQITLTDIEADIVIRHFGANNILSGKVSNDKQKASKTFLLYPDLKPINLNLVYPKVKKTELRLYISSTAGFKPAADDIWFLFENNVGQLVIGSFPENAWNNLGQYDTDDDKYQNEIEQTLTSSGISNISKAGKITISTVNARKVYQRDPRLAALRFLDAGHKCEVDSSHTTFTSQRTNLPYVEAHHFIPMMLQDVILTPLDNFDNIISLCPNCHRAIHHAIIDEKLDLIKNIYSKRPMLHTYGLDDFAQFYNCIKI